MIIGWMLLLIGGFVCLLNFYLSFLRYPLFRVLGGDRSEWKWVSGFPVVGSLAVGIAWILWLRVLDSTAVDVLMIVIVVLDTGGLHWFLFSITYGAVFGKDDQNA